MKTKSTTAKVTLETLKESATYMGVEDILSEVKNSYPEYPDKPRKPILLNKATANEAFAYAKNLKEYEVQMLEYEKDKEAYYAEMRKIDEAIETFIKEVTGFNSVPEKSKEKVWSKAWQDGHSEGWVSVYWNLRELVELF